MAEHPIYAMYRDHLQRQAEAALMLMEIDLRMMRLRTYALGGPRPDFLGPEPPSLWHRFKVRVAGARAEGREP